MWGRRRRRRRRRKRLTIAIANTYTNRNRVIPPFYCTNAACKYPHAHKACVLPRTPCLSKPPAAPVLGCQTYRAEVNHLDLLETFGLKHEVKDTAAPLGTFLLSFETQTSVSLSTAPTEVLSVSRHWYSLSGTH